MKKNHLTFILAFLVTFGFSQNSVNKKENLITKKHFKEFNDLFSQEKFSSKLIKQKLDSFIYYDYDIVENLWTIDEKFEFSYFEDNNVQLFIYEWNETNIEWDYYVKVDYLLDENYNRTEVFYSVWEGEWIYYSKEEYEYDVNQNLIFYTEYYWYSGQWECTNKHGYSYDNFKNKTIDVRYTWNDEISQWELYEKEEYTYDDNNNLTSVYEYVWSGSSGSEWISNYKTIYSYNNNLLIEKLKYRFENYIWKNEEKAIYEYENNNIIRLTKYNWKNTENQWGEFEKLEIIYDGDNAIQKKYFYWNETLNDWESTEMYINSFNNAYQFEDLILPFMATDDNAYFANMYTNQTWFLWDNNLNYWEKKDSTSFHYSEANINKFEAIFILSSQNTSEYIENAFVNIDNVEYGFTDNDGVCILELSNGTYDYTIMSNDYESVSGQITLNNDNITQNIQLVPLPSDENDILSFSFFQQVGVSVINTLEHSISAEVQSGTDLSELVSIFTLSINATAYVNDMLQQSGITINDFSNPLTYTIEAENGDIQNWTITVTEQPLSITIEPLLNCVEENGSFNLSPNPVENLEYNFRLRITSNAPVISNYTFSYDNQIGQLDLTSLTEDLDLYILASENCIYILTINDTDYLVNCTVDEAYYQFAENEDSSWQIETNIIHPAGSGSGLFVGECIENEIIFTPYDSNPFSLVFPQEDGQAKIYKSILNISDTKYNLNSYIDSIAVFNGVVFEIFTNQQIIDFTDVSENKENTKIFIYPNPATGKISVKTNEKINSLTVFDLSGKKVLYSVDINIDLTNIERGIYILEIKTKNQIYIEKIVLK